MKFKIKVTSRLYSQNQYQKTMNFDYSSGYPEMSCFDYNAIETYFQDLTGQIKVDKSITNWTLFIEISLGGAIGKKEICIGKRGITYLADKEKFISVNISLPIKEEISWGIDKKHRFNEYAKRKSDKGLTIIPVDYAQFKDMTDYVESSIKLSLKQVFTDGITLKGHTIKL
ncbi:Imm9 family immunity protein [Bacteroides congonensis]|uniref:Imm9 family immunity protein n=1 Tax=Bacteroides congonensis TaxID=1871006 RepID=UPI001E64792D|nr:Imm9 family immunity protein [Bacteroides congonensis]